MQTLQSANVVLPEENQYLVLFRLNIVRLHSLYNSFGLSHSMQDFTDAISFIAAQMLSASLRSLESPFDVAQQLAVDTETCRHWLCVGN